ncbi:Uncharacterised protein [Mycobacteroides abscessus subsp. abscessus]|nr:Uncharacterised protein [Mycobacteroides abscessus subsp. abscessus]
MGWKTITAALAGAALTMSAAGAAVAEPLPPRTPGLNEVFNGYVVGALQGATAASPDEILRGLRADDPFYEEPPLTGAEQPGTVLKSKKVDVLFTGVKPANLDA